MVYCQDFPCCGHEPGCCPRFDESGNQLDMVCTCGKRLPVTNRFSICDACLNSDEDGEYYDDADYDDDEEEEDDWDDDGELGDRDDEDEV